MSDEVRCVLVKPGDVLLIGNAGDLSTIDPGVLESFTTTIGIHVALFGGDIVIGQAKVEQLTVPKLPEAGA